MLPRFENGIKIILLFLLTNVSSRSYSNQKQEEDDRGQSPLDQVNQLQLQQLDPSEDGYTGPLHSLTKVHLPRHNRVRAYSDRGNFLSRLLDTRQGPVVVFLTPGTDADLELQKSSLKLPNVAEDQAEEDSQEKQDEADEDVHEVYVPQPGENDAYVLYNVLRTTQEDEDLDPEAHEAFEKTKDVLRSAFALRCGARNSCEKKCPEKKPSCPQNCQKVEKKAKNECKQKCPSKPKSCERKCEKVVEKKVDECEQKVDECEEKQEKKCEDKCQKIYDELDSCSPPKPKKCGPKCGKTMPPNRGY